MFLTPRFVYCRPNLDEIDAHPFLVESHIPTFLPTSTLTFAPMWRVNEYGELVCSEKTSSESGNANSKKPALPRSTSSGRQPFASRDPNQRKSTLTNTKPLPRQEKDIINMERVVRTAVAAMTGGGNSSAVSSKHVRDSVLKHGATPPFSIFDESARNPAGLTVESKAQPKITIPSTSDATKPAAVRPRTQQNTTALTEEALIQQTRLLSLSTGVAAREPPAPSSCFTHATESVFSNTENDADVLQHMIDHLETVFKITEARKGTYRSAPPRALSSHQGPSRWVSRYVDYTSKYGLGFLLNDGSSGVYFNDSTKTALGPTGGAFQYIERKRVIVEEDGVSVARRGETTIVTHTLDKYPESLQKKVTLLKHFRDYLLHQQDNEGGDDAAPQIYKSVAPSDLVYVKKWVRTKHAILFALSNRTVQAIFEDQSEILLTPDVAFLTFVDKRRKRFTYNFTDDLVGSSADIEMRLKYMKEMMPQLFSGQRS
jgi:POLO box duplicated region